LNPAAQAARRGSPLNGPVDAPIWRYGIDLPAPASTLSAGRHRSPRRDEQAGNWNSVTWLEAWDRSA